MDPLQFILDNIDIPLVSALIYILNQWVKQTKFPNKFIPYLTFGFGALASIISFGTANKFSVIDSMLIFSLLKQMIIYGTGAILIFTFLHKTSENGNELMNKLFSKKVGK